MYKIIDKIIINEVVEEMVVEAPFVARKCEPGQFIIIRINEDGERVPLTIADYDREKETITIVYPSSIVSILIDILFICKKRFCPKRLYYFHTQHSFKFLIKEHNCISSVQSRYFLYLLCMPDNLGTYTAIHILYIYLYHHS